MRFVLPRLRPFVCSAAVAAAIAALLQPIPAMADPATAPGTATSVPDAGSQPVAVGNLVLPGAPASTPTPTTPSLITPGVPASPILQKVEKGRAEIATLGDQLIRVGQDRDLAQTQLTAATARVTETQQALVQARALAEESAAAAMQQAAAMPPGALDSNWAELDALSRMQRGDATSSYEAAARRLIAAEEAARAASTDQVATNTRYSALAAQWTQLNANLTKKQAAQTKLENDNRAEISAAESRASAADQQLGQEYLSGADAGRGADPRAVQALQFALAQRGDPYVWSEEGPDQYDCSGLMWAAYRSVGFQLNRVSRDQYYQTRERQVSRYSLLPGDLLFFSSSSSWTGIHHVAMYAGEGMMVEAPRSGLNVRLAPVRWTRLFAATRIYGSIEGETETPDLGSPDPDEPVTPTKSPTPGTSTTSKPPASPSPSSSTKPGTGGSPKPSTSSSPPTSTSPSASTSPSSASPTPSASTTPSVLPTPTKQESSPTPTTNTPSSSVGSSTGSAAVTASQAATSGSASSSESASRSASSSAGSGND
ncbi:C40 family peptidase [Actinoplanes xinjiangensis]|uniref:C40 family peptidase n=1 Tax=Actinoplanes xinjiangensis TaxID=512350 RepID=UPI0034384C12